MVNPLLSYEEKWHMLGIWIASIWKKLFGNVYHSVTGKCTFEEVSGFTGNTGYDFSPDNDVDYVLTYADCVQLCLNSSAVFPHPDVLVTEECWGFSMIDATCRIHLVVSPHYFDASNHRTTLATSKLYIKRCFESKLLFSLFWSFSYQLLVTLKNGYDISMGNQAVDVTWERNHLILLK